MTLAYENAVDDAAEYSALADETTDRKFVTALARGLEVLRAFTPTERLLGNQDIAARTGLPKPTVSRLTYTLTRLGYLTHRERLGKYELAPAAISLGYASLANMRIRKVARPHLQALADYANAAVALGARDRLSVIYIDLCRSKNSPLGRLELGSRIPIATTAMGRALIAVMNADEREWLFAQLARREGERWPQIKAGVEAALAESASRGFTLSIGEWHTDIAGVGVALRTADGGLFGFNCGAPAYQLSRKQLEKDIGPRLVNVVRNIEASLNSR